MDAFRGLVWRCRIPMYPQKEVRIDKYPFNRESDATVERTASSTTGIEKLEERLTISLRHRPPIRTARDTCQYSRGASLFLCGNLRLADKNCTRGRGVLRQT